MVKMVRERADFSYNKIMEMSMNLSNINQLQELILIKKSEMQIINHEKVEQYYMEMEVTEQDKLDMVTNGVFRDITLHCMINRHVIKPETFFKHIQNLQKRKANHQVAELPKQDVKQIDSL